MTRKWGCCWPRANGFNGRIQGNEKSRASNHSPSDFRSSIFLQANQYLQSPVRCPPVSRPPIPCRVRPPATSGLAPPSPARPYPRFVFSPIIIDRAPETEPRDETLPARIALAVQEFPFDLRL